MKTLTEHVDSPGPKRILSLDHGGAGNKLVLGLLKRIEEILAKENSNPDFRLCDYFDLIGGTGTSSIIAASLALGMKVSEIEQKLLEDNSAEHVCKKLFGNITLGDDKLIRTGLCLFSKQNETNNIQDIHNHPDGKYFDQLNDQTILQLVQDCIAEPVLLINPSFRLFSVAGQHSSPFHWKLGNRNMLIVSLGTGISNDVTQVDNTDSENIMQLLGESPIENNSDNQSGELTGDSFLGFKAFTYLRYNNAKNIVIDHFKKFLNKHPVGTDGIFFVSGTHYDLPFEPYTKKDIPIGACRIDSDFEIMTMEGLMKAKAGDYLIKGVRGEYYACDAEVFRETYSKATNS